ncbi:hypothetical protein [Spongiactinospora sp. TRM90649]|uniref:wHTH domain-containing protein n=1 Tax=Spongiactinospora sp. TRM90649 TaxID=3031114 RepID=UPI0023F6E43C|nr:hypothetical protein [Spongiactinospora sp. TRM90649]MDF5755355.1 hypothetical protein [Spongiactinospora sp. TRM90649]
MLAAPVVPGEPDHDDVVLLSRGLDGRAPWIDPEQEVAPSHLARGALVTGLTVGGVARRLGRNGCRLPGGIGASF